MGKNVEELFNAVEALKKQIEDIEDVIKDMLDKKQNDIEYRQTNELRVEELEKRQEEVDKVEIECNDCDKIYNDKKSLKLHIKDKHLGDFHCDTCDKIFEVRYKLENHMKEHKSRNRFKCEQCDQEFYLKWRLNQHKKGHKDKKRNFCHFFNNEDKCPYVELGCKFKHEVSEFCKLGRWCRKRLCKYRHKFDDVDIRELYDDVDVVELPDALEIAEPRNDNMYNLDIVEPSDEMVIIKPSDDLNIVETSDDGDIFELYTRSTNKSSDDSKKVFEYKTMNSDIDTSEVFNSSYSFFSSTPIKPSNQCEDCLYKVPCIYCKAKLMLRIHSGARTDISLPILAS